MKHILVTTISLVVTASLFAQFTPVHFNPEGTVYNATYVGVDPTQSKVFFNYGHHKTQDSQHSGSIFQFDLESMNLAGTTGLTSGSPVSPYTRLGITLGTTWNRKRKCERRHARAISRVEKLQPVLDSSRIVFEKKLNQLLNEASNSKADKQVVDSLVKICQRYRHQPNKLEEQLLAWRYSHLRNENLKLIISAYLFVKKSDIPAISSAYQRKNKKKEHLSQKIEAYRSNQLNHVGGDLFFTVGRRSARFNVVTHPDSLATLLPGQPTFESRYYHTGF